jgi:quinol monooxygenase YgiN
MVILRVILIASPAKQKELKQTLWSMVSEMRREDLCSQANACVDVEDENRLFMISLWESRESLDAYMRSERFSALLGSRILLSSPMLAFIETVSMREGVEAILAVRSSARMD